MPDEDKTFSGSLVLDLRIWWGQMHTLYQFISTPCVFFYTEQKKREERLLIMHLVKNWKKKVACVFNINRFFVQV